MKKLTGLISAVGGIISSALGIIGTTCTVCAPVCIGPFVAIFGVGVATFLYKYSTIFIVIGGILFVLGITLIFLRKRNIDYCPAESDKEEGGTIMNCCGIKKPSELTADEIKEQVKKRYGELISGNKNSCCSTSSAGTKKDELTKILGYSNEELSAIPEEAADNSYGCGNPLAFSEVKEGETVLDLGSGAGIDCFIAANKVGLRGKVIGLDMTPEMIKKAAGNAQKAEIKNVEFRLGEMENMPVDNESVDWIISNCVINLSPDKDKVFSEAYRVLKPGGKIMVSDIVTKDLPEEIQRSVAAWTGCVAGALEEKEYLGKIRNAGFTNVQIVSRFIFDKATIENFLSGCVTKFAEQESEKLKEILKNIDGKIISAKIRAVKPII